MEIDGALRIAAGVGCSARGTAVSDLIGRAMRGGESVLLLQTLVEFRERHPQSRNICARRACDDRAWCAVLQVQAALRPRVTPFSARARVLSLTDHLSQKMLAIQFGGTQCPSPDMTPYPDHGDAMKEMVGFGGRQAAQIICVLDSIRSADYFCPESVPFGAVPNAEFCPFGKLETATAIPTVVPPARPDAT